MSSFAWGKRPSPSRGPKPGLNTIDIAQAAILLADKDGIEAVTMQQVAWEVGVTTMALYRYFPGKAKLLAVMIDCAGGAFPEFDKASIWKDRLREWARSCASIYRKHPWFLEATTARRSIMGPNELSWMEAALAILAEAGLSPKQSYFALLAVIGHIRGHATFEQIKGGGGEPAEGIRELTRLLRTEGDRYSNVQAALRLGALSGNGNEAFEYGLNCILEGIGASKRSTRAKAPVARGQKHRSLK